MTEFISDALYPEYRTMHLQQDITEKDETMDQEIYAKRTHLANEFAAAGAALIDFTRTAASIAEIPESQPRLYAVVGTLESIDKILPADIEQPKRRQRHGDRPTEPLSFDEPDTEQGCSALVATDDPANQYRKRPVVIEAIQLTEQACWDYWLDNKSVFGKFTVSGNYHPGRREIQSAWIGIKTLEGLMRADLGDWIIKGVKGEFYPCKPDIFAATYEPASLAAPTGEVAQAEPYAEYWQAGFDGKEICAATRGNALAAYERGIKARAAGAEVAQQDSPPVIPPPRGTGGQHDNTITLSGHQLRMALDFINPDGPSDDLQLDDDLTFGVRQHRDDNGKVSTDMCCWNDDTDGVLPLDGEYPAPTESAAAPADEPDMLWLADDPEVFAGGADDFANDYAQDLRPGETAEVRVDCANRASQRTMRISVVDAVDDDPKVEWSWIATHQPTQAEGK